MYKFYRLYIKWTIPNRPFCLRIRPFETAADKFHDVTDFVEAFLLSQLAVFKRQFNLLDCTKKPIIEIFDKFGVGRSDDDLHTLVAESRQQKIAQEFCFWSFQHKKISLLAI